MEIIKRAMQKKNMTEEQLANKIGVKKKTVSNWANDIEIPSATYQAKLSKVLDIPLYKLADYYNG